MLLKQYYPGCLAHASYLIADATTRTAVVVDPQRDIDQYLHDASEHDFHIRYVFLTHFHADFLAGHLELRDRVGAKGAVGYCMGGTFVTAAAGQFPEEFKAGASLHGVSLVTDEDDSPHRLLHRFEGELYYGFGEIDALSPPAEIAKLDAVLKTCNFKYQIEVHPGADHGYSFPVWPTYQRAGADRNWERIFAMFHRQIPAYA